VGILIFTNTDDSERKIQNQRKNDGVGGEGTGLPIGDCAESCNNLVPRGAKSSAIDVTLKVFFERLY